MAGYQAIPYWALEKACEAIGRKVSNYHQMGKDNPLRWSIAEHALTIAKYEASPALSAGKFHLGNMVLKTRGSQWHGGIVGFYSTSLTTIGYAVESATEKGSVQIYPEAALEAWEVER